MNDSQTQVQTLSLIRVGYLKVTFLVDNNIEWSVLYFFLLAGYRVFFFCRVLCGRVNTFVVGPIHNAQQATDLACVL